MPMKEISMKYLPALVSVEKSDIAENLRPIVAVTPQARGTSAEE